MTGGHVEESTDEDGPLQHERGDQHVKTNATKSIALQKSHEETKADEDHNMDVLEHC